MPNINQIVLNGITYNIEDAEARANITNMQVDINSLFNTVGSPLVATNVSEMINYNKVYIYIGDQTTLGTDTLNTGDWCYSDGTNWHRGGVYNAQGLPDPDTTLSTPKMAAGAKATGDAVTNIENNFNKILSKKKNLAYFTDTTDRTLNSSIQVSFNEDGSVNLNGTGSTYNTYLYMMGATGVSQTTLPAGIYTFTFEQIAGTPGGASLRFRNENSNEIIVPTNDYPTSRTKEFLNDVCVYIYVPNGYSVNGTYRLQIEAGEVATEYEPAIEKIPNDIFSRIAISQLDNRVGNIENQVEHVENQMKNDMVRYCYVDFNNDSEPGCWTATGTITGTASYFHSRKLRVNPGDTLYTPYNNTGSWWGVVGVFFDEFGNFIKSVSAYLTDDAEHPGDISLYECPSASFNNSYTDRMQYLYTFTVPENAYYFSRNVSLETNNRKNKMSIANFPVYALSGYPGDLIIRRGDPNYEYHKNEKIFIIGPSTVFLDKWNPNQDKEKTTFGHTYPTFTENIVGFQEYLVPWVDEVATFGYSGAIWGKKIKVTDNSSYGSISEEFLSANLDISDYDTFLIFASSNGTESYEDETNSNTAIDPYYHQYDYNKTAEQYGLENFKFYFEGIQEVCDYIQAQNPKANIILVVGPGGVRQYNLDYEYNLVQKIYNNTIEFAKYNKNNYGVIDLRQQYGSNKISFKYFTYDGNHGNQEGNRRLGLYLRKQLIGC